MVGCEFEGVAGYGEKTKEKQDDNKRMKDGRKLSYLHNRHHYNGLMTDWG